MIAWPGDGAYRLIHRDCAGRRPTLIPEGGGQRFRLAGAPAGTAARLRTPTRK